MCVCVCVCVCVTWRTGVSKFEQSILQQSRLSLFDNTLPYSTCLFFLLILRLCFQSTSRLVCLAPREPSDNLFSPNGHNLFWPQLIICRANVSLVNMHTHTAWRPCVDSNVLYFVGHPSSSLLPPPPPPFPSPRSMLGGFCQYYRKLEKQFPKCLFKKLKP